MFLCFQSVTGSKTRVSVFKQNTLHTCFVKTQVFKIKTPVFCQNTNTCFQSVTRRCFLTCLDSKHPHLQCKRVLWQTANTRWRALWQTMNIPKRALWQTVKTPKRVLWQTVKTPKRLLWQTVKTKVKCSIILCRTDPPGETIGPLLLEGGGGGVRTRISKETYSHLWFSRERDGGPDPLPPLDTHTTASYFVCVNIECLHETEKTVKTRLVSLWAVPFQMCSGQVADKVLWAVGSVLRTHF